MPSVNGRRYSYSAKGKAAAKKAAAKTGKPMKVGRRLRLPKK
jgi:hypothetical protein